MLLGDYCIFKQFSENFEIKKLIFNSVHIILTKKIPSVKNDSLICSIIFYSLENLFKNTLLKYIFGRGIFFKISYLKWKHN